MEKIRNTYFDNLKSVLITLVVIGHFLLPFESTRFKDGIVYVIYAFHMPMFVMISGYFAKSVYVGGKFCWKKVWKVLWLYVVFQILSGITESLAAGQPLTANLDLLRESGAPWYLLAMVWWYLEIPLLARFRPGVVLLLVTAVGIFSGYGRHIGSFLVISRTLSFAPFFWLGYELNHCKVEDFLRWKGRWVLFGFGLFISAGIALGADGVLKPYLPVVYGMNYGRIETLWTPASAVVRMIHYGAAMVMIWGLMAVVPEKRKMWTRIGEKSLQIYILHRPLRDLLEMAGFYQVITSQYRVTVLLVIGFSVAVTGLLSASWITKLFGYIQEAPEQIMRIIDRNLP